MLGRRPIEPTSQGTVRLRLSGRERSLIREELADLRARLEGDLDDPALERLFPPAYAEAADDEAEYRRLMRGDLLSGHLESLRVFEETLDKTAIGESEAAAWLGAMNQLRLVLGTELDVTDDTFIDDIDRSDPQARELALYAYLTWLQELLVEAVAP